MKISYCPYCGKELNNKNKLICLYCGIEFDIRLLFDADAEYLSKFSFCDQKKKFILLEGLQYGNKFISLNDPEKDEESKTKLADGSTAYKVIGYADTPLDAQGTLVISNDSVLQAASKLLHIIFGEAEKDYVKRTLDRMLVDIEHFEFSNTDKYALKAILEVLQKTLGKITFA